MTRYIQILLLLLMLSLQAIAQNDKTSKQALAVLSADYYSTQTFLKKKYDYELINKRRALVKNSNDLIILSAMLAVGGYVTTVYIGVLNDWSHKVFIPVGTLVGVGLASPIVVWSNHLRKKAHRIQTETAYFLHLGKHTELGATIFSNTDNLEYHTIGIGIKTAF